jgi:pimeloyl-ACP methyl ester carboxylesterase
MKRGFVLLASLLLTGFVTTATAAADHALAWHTCAGDENVECASITVPIDYAHPATGTIDVAVARIRATGRKQGTLVYMPGGPGDSGVGRLLSADDVPVVPPEVAAHFDIVSFDPRGTNGSHPIVCDTNLLGNLPNVVPEAGGRLADVQDFARTLGDDCRARSGPLIDHIDSVSVARDIDAIRAALGDRKVTLYGRSYGTLAGQMYAETFPRHVRGLVLDSVFDHSLSQSALMTTMLATGEDSFTEFAKWCAADTACVLHGQDVGQVYGDLYDKAVAGELPLSPVDLSAEVLDPLYEPDWAQTARTLQDPTAPSTKAAEAPFPLGAFCADHRVRFSSEAEWLSLWHKQNAAAPTLRTHRVWLIVSLCSAWPAATPNPQHRTNAHVPPVLLMNSLHDPATSHVWAQDVNRQIDRSVLLTYDGWGHGVSNRTDCTKAVFTDYVLHGRTPRPGTHCPAAMGDA